jgi:hypothetical protein
MVPTTSLSFVPCASTGVAGLIFVILYDQPGCGFTEIEASGESTGSCTSISVVLASSRSLGTRNVKAA